VQLAAHSLRVLRMMAKDDDLSLDYVRRAARKGPYAKHGRSTMLSEPLLRGCFFAKSADEPSCISEVLGGDEDASAGTDLDAPRRGQAVLACLLEQATSRTAALVAAWMASGFAHGVMNTDNMSILGITLDLNVYGFMERFDGAYTPNLVDDESMYKYEAQPVGLLSHFIYHPLA
jgi:hypothetical protein